MDSSISESNLAQQLKTIPVFSDLRDEDLRWLAQRMQVLHFNPGDVITAQGSPADRMWIVLQGEVRGQREHAIGDGRSYSFRAPHITGMLPYSRLKEVPLTTRAMAPTIMAQLHISHFPEMLQRLPALGPKLVGVLADRIRETTKADQQREKLTALGKLSAGIAHELNNPASAVRNAAIALQQTVKSLRTAGLHLDQRDLSPEDRTFLAQIECDWSKEHPPAALDSLERSDREEMIGDWLEGRGVVSARQLAPDLVDAGCDIETLRRLSARFGGETLVTRLPA
jgi:CRP-like cAMP-binding protein